MIADHFAAEYTSNASDPNSQLNQQRRSFLVGCDAPGNLQTLNLPDQRQLNHLYYGSGNLHQFNLNGRVISDFERDQLHGEDLRTQARLLTRTP